MWPVAYATAISVSFFLVCVANAVGSLSRAELNRPRLLGSRKEQFPVTYIYVVGVEGVGHHGVTPALSVFAKACNNYVEYQPDYLRKSQGQHRGTILLLVWVVGPATMLRVYAVW
jgi:hypothetical protein